MAEDRLATMLTIGLTLVAFGYLFRFRQALWLVIGADPERIGDPEGLARFLGTYAILAGVVSVLVGMLDYGGALEGLLWPLYVGTMVAIATRVVMGAREYA